MKSKLNIVIGILIGAGIILLFNQLDKSTKISFEDLPKPYYNILYDNGNIRIVEHKLKPGETEPMHGHPPMYAYFLEDAEVLVHVSDEPPEQVTLKKGQTLELPALSHSIENQGSTTLHSIFVEIGN